MASNNLHYLICKRLLLRKYRYLSMMGGERVATKFIIVGDRPSPSGSKDPNYHNTPFYSLMHCSGWLNSLLEVARIKETDLLWINSADERDRSTNYSCLSAVSGEFVTLGNNAEKWLSSHYGGKFHKTFHPQYWKRFRNKESYPLLNILTS